MFLGQLGIFDIEFFIKKAQSASAINWQVNVNISFEWAEKGVGMEECGGD